MKHSKVIEFRFVGATNTKPSRVIITDKRLELRATLSLSGADMLETVMEHLASKAIKPIGYGYIGDSGDKGVILTNDFIGRIA